MKNLAKTSVLKSRPLIFLKFPLLLLLIFFSLMACRSSEDEDENEIPDNTIVGIWQPYKATMSGNTSAGTFVDSVVYTDCQQRGRMIFSAAETGTLKTYNSTNGNCTMQSETAFTYSFNTATNAITITEASGNKLTGTVKSLTTSELALELTGSTTFHGEPNVQVKTELTLRRTKD